MSGVRLGPALQPETGAGKGAHARDDQVGQGPSFRMMVFHWFI